MTGILDRVFVHQNVTIFIIYIDDLRVVRENKCQYECQRDLRKVPWLVGSLFRPLAWRLARTLIFLHVTRDIQGKGQFDQFHLFYTFGEY
jgi:hypothetical protein